MESQWLSQRSIYKLLQTSSAENRRRADVNNLPVVMSFTYFKRAFDSVHRGKNVRVYGLPEKILNAIEVLYKDTTAFCISPDGETE